jgi:hypothetical protein
MSIETPVILRASPQEFIELSGIEKFSDGSGYRAQLAVSSGRFSCSGHPFYFDDLNRFAKEITEGYGRVEGKARLAYRYESDFLEIDVRRGGHVSVVGFVVQYGPPRQELRFAFECDQTFLPELMHSLSQAVKELGENDG